MKLKFVCLNLWLGGKLFPAIIDFLNEEKPDILVAQEVYNGKILGLEDCFYSIDVLKKNCGFQYDFFSPACIDVRKEGKIENGNAVLSRFPITKTKTVFFDVPFGERTNVEGGDDYSMNPRNLQYVQIKVDQIKLNVFNTQGIWGLDGGDNERRLKMSETIVNEIRGMDNVILAGDFNLKPNTKTIENIEKHLRNVFKDELTTTFNMKQKTIPGYATAVVDMIFTSNNLKVVEKYCPNVNISDHFPLVVILEK
ncbi:MAG TPA: endonuclease/exonuclease/phosphatase family protein [Patescibacteria group bacterium]|nr:endonuclease/exonuclease/phosphatase family protein [Patescibacteria group bacterium]